MLSDVAQQVVRLACGQRLTAEEIADVFETISREDADGYYYLAFVVALMARGGPSAAELLGLVEGLQRFAVGIEVPNSPDRLVDLSGSGGDGAKTFNVSTAASFVVAACGVGVAKQSFRAFTSYSGSSDVLVDLGVRLPIAPREVTHLMAAVGIAPIDYVRFYPGMEKRLAAVSRLREMGLTFPTPMHPIALVPSPLPLKHRLYGLYSRELLRPIAEIFRTLDYEHVLVVHGSPGIDEVSTMGSTSVCELRDGTIKEYELTVHDLGLPQVSLGDVQVASRDESTDVLLAVLAGSASQARIDLVAANAGVALYAAGAVDNPRAGVEVARRALSDGSALGKLHALVEQTAGNQGMMRLEHRLSGITRGVG